MIAWWWTAVWAINPNKHALSHYGNVKKSKGQALTPLVLCLGKLICLAIPHGGPPKTVASLLECPGFHPCQATDVVWGWLRTGVRAPVSWWLRTAPWG